MNYQPNQSLLLLLLKPWVLIPRVIKVITSFASLIILIIFQGSREEESVQKFIGTKILKTLTDLGPCFIKIGQALSTRPDLVKRAWLDELTKLQDSLPPFSHSIAIDTIETELGSNPNILFESFPEEPIAAASLGQVYKAKLHGEYWVAVKVQRPGLEWILQRDLVIIKALCIMVSPVLPLNLGVGLGEIIDEFGRSLFEEIDYRKEADNAERFADLFATNPAVIVPKVERLLSSKKVITTSWINGTKLQERDELLDKGLNPSKIIRTGVTSGIQQLLEFGYFHADPHPGNMFALNGTTGELGHLAYVDFGMMDSISNKDRITLTSAVVHLINKDFYSLAKDFQSLGFLTPEQELEPIAPVLEEVLGGSLGESVESFNFKSITDKFSELMFDYPFRVPARFALIIRAVVSQEGLALRLDPKFKIIRVAYPYVAKRLLTGETKEMIGVLLEVIFDKDSNLQIERLESLIRVLSDTETSTVSSLIPIVKAGTKLLLSDQGDELRKKLLMTLIKDERLNTSDLKSLVKLLGRTFNARNIAGGLAQRFNPLAA
ncbi:AarF/ABC1/UbiB kinase family protein [Prochlorococcus sp. MIT 1300]|uniref:ABC1 kinase family protein n=1 Tax=Prochlorococcus sp. MIT 1300 TaxID=3096218 RepID=UPI002A764E53|nr:AarF/ABC1/UbiB kinase family protein [Prochlorococcus sp. MIT 1300]